MLALVRESEEGWGVEVSTQLHVISQYLEKVFNFFKALKYIVYLNTMSPPENRTMTIIADKHHLNLSRSSFVDSTTGERAGVTNQDMVIRSD